MSIIAFILAFVALAVSLISAAKRKQEQANTEANLEALRDALQDIADKVDADFDTLKLFDERSRTNAAALSLQLVSLAKALSYELKDGVWSKIVAKKPVAKPATNVAKTATKKGGK